MGEDRESMIMKEGQTMKDRVKEREREREGERKRDKS